MSLRQAAQRALKAMEDGEWRADMVEFSDALIALRAALAEPEQEPVAWMLITPYGEEDDIVYTEPEIVPDGWSYKPLYDTAPTPRQWVSLTEQEMYDLFFHDQYGPRLPEYLVNTIKCIEAALKEKNSGS